MKATLANVAFKEAMVLTENHKAKSLFMREFPGTGLGDNSRTNKIVKLKLYTPNRNSLPLGR